MKARVMVPIFLAAASAAVAPMPVAGASEPRCTTAHLSAHLGQAGGAAGSVYQPIVWTNKSHSACTLFGYPGVSYVAPSSGKQVGAAATHNTQHPPRTVTLQPGGHASALVQMADYQNYPKAKCQPTAVSGLRVYPPGSHSAEFVKFATQRKACSTRVHQLSVEATVKGKAGQ